MSKKRRATPNAIEGDTYLAAQLASPRFRHAFEQRRIIHEVALAVKGMRQAAGLTQAQLARRIGTSQPMIARIEKGLDQRTPQFDTLQRIASALGRQLKLVFSMPTTQSVVVEIERPPRRKGRPSHTGGVLAHEA
jgi:DNA-binding XRE family transcriptional regulator